METTLYTKHLERVQAIARANYYIVSDDIYALVTLCENNKIQPCKARRDYAKMRKIYLIDSVRLAKLLSKKPLDNEPKQFSKGFNPSELDYFDRYFAYTL